MKKLIVFFSLLIGSLVLTSFETSIPATENAKVYVCTGGSSKRYHKTPYCNGLRNCSGEVKPITIKDAEKLGRTPCKICF